MLFPQQIQLFWRRYGCIIRLFQLGTQQYTCSVTPLNKCNLNLFHSSSSDRCLPTKFTKPGSITQRYYNSTSTDSASLNLLLIQVMVSHSCIELRLVAPSISINHTSFDVVFNAIDYRCRARHNHIQMLVQCVIPLMPDSGDRFLRMRRSHAILHIIRRYSSMIKHGKPNFVLTILVDFHDAFNKSCKILLTSSPLFASPYLPVPHRCAQALLDTSSFTLYRIKGAFCFSKLRVRLADVFSKQYPAASTGC